MPNLSATMGELVSRPLVCITLTLAGGIALAAALGPCAVCMLSVGVLILTLLAAVVRRRWLAGWLILTVAGLGGAGLFVVDQRPYLDDISQLPEGGQTIVGTVAGPPYYSGGMWRFVLKAEEHIENDRAEPITGKVYVRLYALGPVQRGQRWRLIGKLRPLRDATNPGQRSEAQRLASLDVSSVFTVGAAELAECLGDGDLGLIGRHAYAAQRRALAILENHLPGPYRENVAAVAASVIFGVHSAPPPREITEIFRRAGTIHLLVVSGAIISMVFGLVFLPGALGATWRRLRTEPQRNMLARPRGRILFRPGVTAAVLAIIVVTYYAVLTEGGQAVARAAVMGIITGLALAFRRIPAIAREHALAIDHYTLVAVAALGILAVTPDALFQPGFQLSFAAVLALLYLTPKAVWLFGGLPKWVAYTVVGTIAAQLATFPILACHYGQAPIAGFGANLFAIPIAAVVLVGGLATCTLGVLWPLSAPIAGFITAQATRGMIWTSAAFASLAYGSVEVQRPSVVHIVLWYGALIIFGSILARRDKEPSRSPSN